jgi:membrane-bound ClpP family serine protease
MKVYHNIRFSLILVLLFVGISFAGNGEIIVIPVSDAIGPGIAEFVSSGISRADDQEAVCVFI